jgi:List-Bact-rpt repeat protein
MAYDAADGYVVLFGGDSCAAAVPYACNDTWTYHQGNWTRLNLSVAPGPRADALMAYDAADHCLVLFGGSAGWVQNGRSIGYTFHDTWTFQNGSWKNVTGPVSPRVAGGDRYSSAMTFDAADGYLMLAAYTNSTGGFNGGSIHTWKYVSGTWSELTSAVLPGFLQNGAVAVYDPGLGRVVLSSVLELSSSSPFGGYSSTWWGFRNGSWGQLDAPGLVNVLTGADWVPAANAVVGFGGAGFGGGPAGELSSTWWLQGLASWSLNLSPSPSARQDLSATYDGSDSYLLVFGGVDFATGVGQGFNDTWAYRPAQTGAPLASVRISVVPDHCGPLLWDSTPVGNGTTLFTTPGPHVIQAPPCPGTLFGSWSSSGGVAVGGSAPNASVSVQSNGSLTAQFATVYSVNITVRPAVCGSVVVGGVRVADGGVTRLLAGRGTPILAPVCANSEYEFRGWNVTPAVSLNGSNPDNSTASLLVSGNGTLVAVYDRIPPSTDSPDWALFADLAVALGVGIGTGGLAVWWWRIRRRTPPPPSYGSGGGGLPD